MKTTSKIILSALVPIILSIVMVAGIIIGSVMNSREQNRLLQQKTITPNLIGFNRTNKVSELLNMIATNYVDNVSMDSLTDLAVPYILAQLDPHSAYIPASDLQGVNEDLEGSFGGIGVQFNLQHDTIYVVNVIANGPSDKVGLLPGDRIVAVNDTMLSGTQISNKEVMARLRGHKGTCVRLGVLRRSEPGMLEFNVIRDDIPMKSVDAAYIIAPQTGYILINKFGMTTYQEFLAALAKVRKAGATKLIIDLRGNGGGFMDAAVNILNEFFTDNALLVYMQGKHYPPHEYRANGSGAAQNMKIAVLIDEFSASASEIFAGAIQDNDRGIIIGRRSFGKGLVQNQTEFSDGSAVRLTIARYYTPSGRCIQKPYRPGHMDDYNSNLQQRFEHGEFFAKDSIRQNDSLVYVTVGGRTVYGGGGIMPDIFVAEDTTPFTPYFNRLYNRGHIYQFALRYTDEHRAELKQYDTWQALDKHLRNAHITNQLIRYAAARGTVGSAADKRLSQQEIERQLHGYIIRNILDDDGFFPYYNNEDPTVQRAIRELTSNKVKIQKHG